MEKLILIMLASLLLAACAHDVIVKDCKQAGDSNKSICRIVLPWE